MNEPHSRVVAVPTSEHLVTLSKQFEEGDEGVKDKALRLVYGAYPKNERVEEILSKVALLDNLYRTCLLGKEVEMARHILQQNTNSEIDRGILEGDLSVIGRIRDGAQDNYSFASKFLSFHNPNAFPVFDNKVDKLIHGWRGNLGLPMDLVPDALRNYPTYRGILVMLMGKFKLQDLGFKKFDQALWMYAKETEESKCKRI